MTSVTEQLPQPEDKPDEKAELRHWETCLASLFGGLFVGLADVIFNTEPVTFRIAEAARQVIGDIAFSVSFETIAFVLILGLGLGLCFVYRPETRLGAFGRGSSVIAVMAGMNIAAPAAAKADEILLDASTEVSSCEPRAYGVLGLGTLIHGDAKGCWRTGLAVEPRRVECLQVVRVGKESFCQIELPPQATRGLGDVEDTGWVKQ